jgi:hypothetical protein
MTRLAESRPPYCASCFTAPEGRCVDFEAAYDGPVVPGTPEPVPVDDLIVCESCLAEAFALLDPQNLQETIAELVEIVNAQQAEIKAKDKAIRGFNFTTSELIEHPVAPIPGKPRLEGVPKEVREQITKGLYSRRGSSPAPKKPGPKPKVKA